MTASIPAQDVAFDACAEPERKPCIALMGEFSAGKSTLANLLLGQDMSPVRVTATQLPPVWYVHGSGGMVRQPVDGPDEPLDDDGLEGVPVAQTRAVRVPLDAPVLEFCDLVDMPGSGDPNMPADVWDRMLGQIDGAVWCTPATQAWRQSEAALWDHLPAALHRCSLLLVTRMDMLDADRDRQRVLGRLRRETAGRFRAVMPISLTQALAAGEDLDALAETGADAFAEALMELVEAIRCGTDAPPPAGWAAAEGAAAHEPAERGAGSPSDAPAAVVPRRVTAARRTRSARPQSVSAHR